MLLESYVIPICPISPSKFPYRYFPFNPLIFPTITSQRASLKGSNFPRASLAIYLLLMENR